MNLSTELSFGRKKGPKIPMGSAPVADLVPPRSREERALRMLKRRWIFGGLLVTAIMCASIFAAFSLQLAAKSSYNSSVASQKDLTAEAAKYSEVSDALGKVRDLQTKQRSAYQSEVDWVATINKVQSQLPPGVKITGYTALGGGNPLAKGKTSVAFTMNVSSSSPIAYSEILSIFSKVDGLTDVQIGDLAGADGVYTYPVAFGVDDSALVKRYEPKTDATNSDTQDK